VFGIIRHFESCWSWVFEGGGWRAPQQTLQTHRSLKAYYVIQWWRWLFVFVFPCNWSPVEWNWTGKTVLLGEKPVLVSICPPQIPHGLKQDRPWASAVRGRRLTAWSMARSLFLNYNSVRPNSTSTYTHSNSVLCQMNSTTTAYLWKLTTQGWYVNRSAWHTRAFLYVHVSRSTDKRERVLSERFNILPFPSSSALYTAPIDWFNICIAAM
jgi:hypothetical protein